MTSHTTERAFVPTAGDAVALTLVDGRKVGGDVAAVDAVGLTVVTSELDVYGDGTKSRRLLFAPWSALSSAEWADDVPPAKEQP